MLSKTLSLVQHNRQHPLWMTYSLPSHNTSDPPSVSIATLHMWLLSLSKLLICLKYTQPLYYFYLTLSLALSFLSPSLSLSLLAFFSVLQGWCHSAYFLLATQNEQDRERQREKREDEYWFPEIPPSSSSSSSSSSSNVKQERQKQRLDLKLRTSVFLLCVLMSHAFFHN